MQHAELFQETAIGVVAVSALNRPDRRFQVKLGWVPLLKLNAVPVRNLLISDNVPTRFVDAALIIGLFGKLPFYFHDALPLLNLAWEADGRRLQRSPPWLLLHEIRNNLIEVIARIAPAAARRAIGYRLSAFISL
jgi:hypothetical protein